MNNQIYTTFSGDQLIRRYAYYAPTTWEVLQRLVERTPHNNINRLLEELILNAAVETL